MGLHRQHSLLFFTNHFDRLLEFSDVTLDQWKLSDQKYVLTSVFGFRDKGSAPNLLSGAGYIIGGIFPKYFQEFDGVVDCTLGADV